MALIPNLDAFKADIRAVTGVMEHIRDLLVELLATQRQMLELNAVRVTLITTMPGRSP